MSEVPISWYHCGHCGALFHASLGAEERRLCPGCGRDPSLGVATSAPKKIPFRPKGSDPDDQEWRPHNERHRKRHRKSGAPIILLVIGWSMVMAVILLVANRYWKGKEVRSADWKAPEEKRLTAEQHEFIREHAAACQDVIANVLSHVTPEQLNPYVFNSRGTFPDMMRYYRMNPGTQMMEVPIRSVGITVLELPEGPAIEGRWVTEDGRFIDAVFREENGEWRLDWHHFARFSEHPWPLFLAGDGPEQAEFRLLVRRRLVRSILDMEGRPLSLVFHAPRFARPDDPGPPSPVFELDFESKPARILMAGFNQARNGQRPFQSLLPRVEPDEDMMRVRVVMRRIEGEEERRFEIVDVLACHWLQHEDLGVSLGETQ